MKKQSIVSIASTVFGFLLLCQAKGIMASAEYFKNSCGNTCHRNEEPTCNGCHGHGTHSGVPKNDINLTATMSKYEYQPGEEMIITVSGGYKLPSNRKGWVRINLYNNAEAQGTPILRNTKGSDLDPEAPITLKVPAPNEPSTYTYSISWFGNKRDKYPDPTFENWRDTKPRNHGEEIVKLKPFTVRSTVPSEIPPEASAARVIQR